MGVVLSLFVIFHNGNPYKLISLNSPDFIKVNIDLYPAVFVVTLTGKKLFPEVFLRKTIQSANVATQNNHGPGLLQLNP